MGYQAWNLFTDFQYRREVAAWHDAEDALDAEQAELERAERDRHQGEDVRLPLVDKAGRQ